MGKASLEAYRRKRDRHDVSAFLASRASRRGVHSQRTGGFGGVKSAAPFGGSRRKDGQSINWGLVGAVGVRSYDGPKRFVPKPELAQEQRDARKWYYSTRPQLVDEFSPPEYRVPVITDSLGFRINNGPCVYDMCNGPKSWGQKYHWPSGVLPAYEQVEAMLGDPRGNERDELDLLMADYLAKGGTVTICKRGKRMPSTFHK